MATGVGESVLTLTDDEVVAVAIAQQTYYAGDLPTVDAESEEDLLAASLRGQRSLIARGWIGDDDALAAELGPALAPAGASSFIYVFIGDEQLNRVDWTLATSLYNDPPTWVVESVDGTGLHRFAQTTRDEVQQSLDALVAAAFAGAPSQPAPDGAWVIVSTVHASSGRVLATRPGSVRSAEVQEGRLSAWTTVRAGDTPDWIETTMRSMDR